MLTELIFKLSAGAHRTRARLRGRVQLIPAARRGQPAPAGGPPRTRAAVVRLGACAVAGAVTVAGCAVSAGAGARHHPQQGAAAYWNRSRLLGAQPFAGRKQSVAIAGRSHLAGPRSGLRIGALFERDASGNHFCTASVVASPGKDLLITAAHCINGGKNGTGYRRDIVFIPDYRDGREPFGVWTPAKLLVAPQWADSSSPAYDVGFVVLQKHDGENIEQVLGANRLGTDYKYIYFVHVTGYPNSSNAPITCVNWTSQWTTTELRFECGGYTGGTSGSPWVIKFSPRSHTGVIVGVIGGFQDGGDSPSISYSAVLGPAIQRLYRQAEAASSKG